jgi:hypothetical protein
MQHLGKMWQLVNAAGAVRDLTRHTKTYFFAVPQPITFYLQTEGAVIQLNRWARPMVEVTVKLQGSFGWRVLTDQDEVGVYVVAKRRAIVGSLSSALFEVFLPHTAHVILQTRDCDLQINHLNGELQLPPSQASHSPPLLFLESDED